MPPRDKTKPTRESSTDRRTRRAANVNGGASASCQLFAKPTHSLVRGVRSSRSQTKIASPPHSHWNELYVKSEIGNGNIRTRSAFQLQSASRWPCQFVFSCVRVCVSEIRACQPIDDVHIPNYNSISVVCLCSVWVCPLPLHANQSMWTEWKQCDHSTHPRTTFHWSLVDWSAPYFTPYTFFAYEFASDHHHIISIRTETQHLHIRTNCCVNVSNAIVLLLGLSWFNVVCFSIGQCSEIGTFAIGTWSNSAILQLRVRNDVDNDHAETTDEKSCSRWRLGMDGLLWCEPRQCEWFVVMRCILCTSVVSLL